MFLHRGKIYAIFRVLKVYIFAQVVVHVPPLLIIQIQFTLIRTVLKLESIPSFLLVLTGVVHVPLQTLKQFILIRTVLQDLDNIPSFLFALTGVVHVPLQTLNPTVALME